MEKLMKPAEYAQELGISRQAVYAKIKRGILPSKNVDGKLYIVVDNTQEETKKVSKETTQANKPESNHTALSRDEIQDYKALLQAKDETISVLKDTVEDLKESNKQISTTLRGEVDLLKDAFYEMRTLYVQQLEYKKSKEENETIEVDTHESQQPEHWIGLKKFFKQWGIEKEKKQEKCIKRLKKALKKGDERLRKSDGKLKLNAHKKYDDILS